ncbi:MAG: ion transporter [Thermoanaerobaculia bacterium]|nr:ion transporter [Thermoanaerobaculia bacterium]
MHPVAHEAEPSRAPWRSRLHEVIFEADTPLGKAFDVALLWCILLSVLAVVIDSVPSIHQEFGTALLRLEWLFTILFTVEYVLRLLCVRRPAVYARSFFGLVDLLAILPTYLSVVYAGSQSLIVIRALRLLRVFRVLKLAHFVGAQKMLHAALRASTRKIVVFLGVVLTLVVIIGSVMYLVEGPTSGFTSIPQSMYWAIVTMTTVGYGDIAPMTVLGKMLASTVMILGYGIIAVPTGIVTVEMSRLGPVSTHTCKTCGRDGHDPDAVFCKYCGARV